MDAPVHNIKMPYIDSQMVDPTDGSIAAPWNRFFQVMYQKMGGTFSPLQGATYVVQNPTGGLDAYDSLTGKLIGHITTT